MFCAEENAGDGRLDHGRKSEAANPKSVNRVGVVAAMHNPRQPCSSPPGHGISLLSRSDGAKLRALFST